MSRDAVIQMPNMQQLGGQQAQPQPPRQPAKPDFVRMPYYPTAPYYSTNPNVGYQPRYYGATLLSTDADYTQNSESIRIVQFDMPCVLVAINGSSFRDAATAFPLGYRPNDCYLFRIEYSTGDKLMTAARMASTVIGDGDNPGEIGGYGYTINPGASVVLGITPLLADQRIDITLVCLEARGPSNYTLGG